jgi:hypothetical protein
MRDGNLSLQLTELGKSLLLTVDCGTAGYKALRYVLICFAKILCILQAPICLGLFL